MTIHRSTDDDKTFEMFESVEVDGEVVDPENYTVKAGSLILTFKPEFLKTLAGVKHTVKVIFTDGKAEATLTVNKAENSVLPGDVNGDGKLTITDVSKAAAQVKGIKPLDETEMKAADVNGDGKVNVTDVSKIAAHVKGIRPLS